MSKLAEALATDTTMINDDVQNMFEFEKNISKVWLFVFFPYVLKIKFSI